MQKNQLDPTRRESVDENRRSLLIGGAAAAFAATIHATAGLAQETLAAEMPDDFSDIPYRESDLGIDYHALADFPVDHMLSQGEAEFMATAIEHFGTVNAPKYWERMAPLIGEGRVSETFVRAMKLHTPNMLLSFARLDPNHPKYGLLVAHGLNFQLDEHIGDNPLLASLQED